MHDGIDGANAVFILAVFVIYALGFGALLSGLLLFFFGARRLATTLAIAGGVAVVLPFVAFMVAFVGMLILSATGGLNS